MAVNEIAKAAVEASSSGVENRPGKFEVPRTQDVTDTAATRPERFDAQEIKDKLGDIPTEAESTKQIDQVEKGSEPADEGENKSDAQKYDLEGEHPEPIQNKKDGLRREAEVEDELRGKYPESEGYSIQSEAYLRDKDGNIAKDPVTGEARRVDFVTLDKDGNVVDSIEVTSRTADKTDQSAKEQRIRENGGNYIKTSDGKIAEIPEDVLTRIERRD
ncbi:MAG: hypothetical protein FWH25_04700 [Syntrophorhabdaceae bacterium]|nr:hypothetical protein [Syntrophorhabdaceae bacterium]